MMTIHCLVPIIPARWARFCCALLLVALAAPMARAQSLADLTRAYLERKSSQNKQALLDYADEHSRDYTGALARLAVGATLTESENGWKEGTDLLSEAAPQLVRLKDYVSYYSAVGLYEQHEDETAARALEPVINDTPVSPLRAEAVMLAASIYYENKQPQQTVDLIQTHLDELPKAKSLALLADALVAVGRNAEAARTYQRVYYEYPTSPEASTASSQLSRLRRSLGSEYPEAAPAMKFTRVDALIEAERHDTARSELQDMTEDLDGADRDRARVWLGKARHIRRNDDIAYRWLSELNVTDPRAEAERLYWLVEASRRLGRRTAVANALENLAKNYPASGWRMRALVTAGNMYLVLNQPDDYRPIYRACADTFAPEPDAAYCDWKFAWSHYIRRLPDAAELLRNHLRTFPRSEHTAIALYFLGRLAEKDADQSAARAWYEKIVSGHPNDYYAVLARERLAWEPIATAVPSVEVVSFLETVTLPDETRELDFERTEGSDFRNARAQLLTTAGLYEWAEQELYFSARTEGHGAVLAMELARLANRREDYGRSIRYVKALAPDYMHVPLDEAPDPFWRLAFPLPYREQMEEYAGSRNLDLDLLAAVIRQESEFDKDAKSSAGAIGLTQILPATGRQIYRQLGYDRYSDGMLTDPAINLNMGTFWMRGLIDEMDGHVEAVLAAYNAGKTRAEEWLKWEEYREPAEFIETVPFTETRTYIRAVLRNADFYRRIYE